MLLKYWEKQRVTRDDLAKKLTSLGISDPEQTRVIAGIIEEKGEATISHYQFGAPAGDRQGTLTVCHDLGRGAISFGPHIRWGQWDEDCEVLTLENGEKFSYEGKPVYEGDDGSCSLGNI